MISLIFLNFLRFLTDAAIYYSFAGFFALKTGGGNILPGLLIPSICYAFSRYFYADTDSGSMKGEAQASDLSSAEETSVFPRTGFRHNRFLRELFLLPCILCLVLPGLAIADRIAALPPIIYAGLLVYRSDYTLSAYRQNDIFDFFWKAYLAFGVLCLLFGNLTELASVSLPAAVCALIISVYLLRILRHDTDIYQQPAFLLRSTLPLIALGLLAGFLSIPAVLELMKTILYTLYSITVVPLLLGVSYVFGWIVLHTIYPLLQWLASMSEQEEITLELTSAADLLQDSVDQEKSLDPTAQLILKIVGITLLVLIVLFLLFLLYRKLTASNYSQETSAGLRQERTSASVNTDAAPLSFHFPLSSDPALQIRKTYRAYLKLCGEKGFVPPDSYTSRDICKEADHIFHDPEKDRKALELREIYIQARYQGKVTAAQAKRARELVTELRKKDK